MSDQDYDVMQASDVSSQASLTDAMDAMDSASLSQHSHRSKSSHKSRKSSSTLSSLLSNKSLDLVFGLIDDYYQGVHRGPSQPSTADLLGNIAPSKGLAALAAAADVHDVHGTSDQADVIARAIHVADADGQRLEELLALLSAAQSHASATAGISREQLQVHATYALPLMSRLRLSPHVFGAGI